MVGGQAAGQSKRRGIGSPPAERTTCVPACPLLFVHDGEMTFLRRLRDEEKISFGCFI